MEQSHSRETNFMEPEVHYRIHKSPPPALYPGAGAPFRLLKINFNIILLCTRRCSQLVCFCLVSPSHLSRFDHPQNIWWAVQSTKLLTMLFGEPYRARNSSLCYLVSRTEHETPHYVIWWTVQSTKLLTMLFLHFLVTSVLWAPDVSLKYPRPMFFSVRDQVSHPHTRRGWIMLLSPQNCCVTCSLKNQRW